MANRNARASTKPDHAPDRPAPSHQAELEARTKLHATPSPDQRGLNLYSYIDPDDPRTQLLDSISVSVHQIITSVESLFREAQNRPTKKNTQTRRLHRTSRMVEDLRSNLEIVHAGIDLYLSLCSSLGDRPVEWIQGWRESTDETKFHDFIQYAMCAFACHWKCEERCKVNFPSDFLPHRVRRRGRVKSHQVAATSRPNPSRFTHPTVRPPVPPTRTIADKQSSERAPLPVDGCAVTTEQDANVRLGEVLAAIRRGKHHLVEVAWGRDREVGSHMPSELTSGFQVGDTVQEIPKSNTARSRGTGSVVGTNTVAGEQLVFVKFHETGNVDDIPFHLLRRVISVEDKFMEPDTSRPDAAERFRLRCLAHGLESWNDRSGSLDRLPVDPMPHQIHIVHRIMTSDQTNWLIADDVGLGKTIEVGLLLAAKKRRRRLNRVLVVCPAALTKQWQDEMQDKFEEDFRIYGTDFNVPQPSHWSTFDKVIVSIDRAKLPGHLSTLRSSPDWDIVVFDEAHHLSKKEHAGATLRYELAEILRDKTDEFLFLTGTPHQGNNEQFTNLLRLLRPDLFLRYEGGRIDPSVVAQVILKNRKDTVIDQYGKPVFHGQETYRIEAEPSYLTQEFHKQLESYLRLGYAASETGDSQRRAIGFVMTTYRKLASSSIYAIERSLKRRRDTLTGALTLDYQDAARRLEDLRESIINNDDSDVDDLATLTEAETKRSLGSDPFFDNEKSQLDELIQAAGRASAHDRKLQTFLNEIVRPRIRQGEKLLVFTEYRATQDYLSAALMKAYPGADIAHIHGGMSLDEKRDNVWRFNNGDAAFMISTEAGGEGINLQDKCNTLVNYDIPWNPRRLVQRAGRLYRYGQKRRVNVYNLVVEDSFDNKFLSMILEKIHAMAKAMSEVDDRSSLRHETEILGELLENLPVAGALGQNTEMDASLTEEEAEKNAELAKQAKNLNDQLFANVEGYDQAAATAFRSMSPEDVLGFVEGMLPLVGATVRKRSHNRRVLAFRLPDNLVGRFTEFRNRKEVSVTADRALRTQLKDVAQMDFESGFFAYLIGKAKSPEFGGDFASIIGESDATYSLFKLRWKDGQGTKRWSELMPVKLVSGAQTASVDSDLFDSLSSGMRTAPDGAPNADPVVRAEILQRMSELADKELASRKTPLRHPNDVVLLAAADIIADK